MLKPLPKPLAVFPGAIVAVVISLLCSVPHGQVANAQIAGGPVFDGQQVFEGQPGLGGTSNGGIYAPPVILPPSGSVQNPVQNPVPSIGTSPSPAPFVPAPITSAPIVVAPSSSGISTSPSRAVAATAESQSKKRSSDPNLQTLVTITSDLQELLEKGGEPTDLVQLRSLERQVQKVAKQAVKCTVSVQIGPAQGCGVIITESGYILTAAHVAMRPNKRASITLSDGRRVFAKTLGMNRRVDAGLMKIEPNQNSGRPWPRASLGNSDKVRAGMWCVATGHPGGYDAARGPVARVGRILSSRPGAIETDCALIGGDSGGPLFDIAGRLIAVHSRIGNDVTENLHIPIDYYGKSWDRMRSGEAYGYLPGFRPVLGVRGKTKSPTAKVTVVKRGSPAEEAGIRIGDTILQFGEVGVSDFKSLQHAVSQTMPGERVPIILTRESGATKRVIVEIGRAD